MDNAVLSELVTIFNVHPHLFPQNKTLDLNCWLEASVPFFGLSANIPIRKIVLTCPSRLRRHGV